MVAVKEELCLGAARAGGDGWGYELVEHPRPWSLQQVGAPSLGERLDPGRRLLAQVKQGVAATVRFACNILR